ncbi:tRNA (guanine-N(7)-)-methyltransferase non-catalytic subunit TRM82 [Mycena indigotica]|uniref:tRNA (Guanine-N(7)-)-methyltransferase non-catalytic subunit TRM82 n=1 Tax=Mycena indigotica TaxID=2126181 RepID=A0A8H6T4A2_9AGAR|nr:tRNA (guanine-N(7)-)-methyltransferase non-catalytic subunit TRM82 [Mycena indigotica]KAF7309971.1 tRNA (guanine-N(7)-)-methyltransferase non-catalytic subunit TRM82 [Mycena indigotica]
MAHFPYTHLFLTSSIAVVIAGEHIQTLDVRTGSLISTTVGRDGSNAGPIRAAAIDSDGRHLVTVGDDKQLKVWRLDGLELFNQRELPKRPTALGFTKNGDAILAADKFGDIFSYPLEYVPPTAPIEDKSALYSSHENPSGGRLILGHVSLLNAFVLSDDEKYIITADRDEHVRVSWYPQGYTIESYCLGHTQFVSAIHIPCFAPDVLISGGGDPVLKVWDWLGGRFERDIPISDAVEPYIRVKPARKTPRRFGDQWDGRDDGKKGKKRRKGKGKSKGGADANEQPEPLSVIAAEEVEGLSVETQPDEDQKILAISCIKSRGRDVLFSAYGATALFSFTFPESNSAPHICALELEKPVLDFNVQDDGVIWICVDGGWSPTGHESDRPGNMVRLAKIDAGAKLFEITAQPPPLLTALNSTTLLPATQSELTALDLYGSLTALPKGRDSEHDPMDREAIEGHTVELSKKELGRLKTKKAVAKQQGNDDEEGRADVEMTNVSST